MVSTSLMTRKRRRSRRLFIPIAIVVVALAAGLTIFLVNSRPQTVEEEATVAEEDLTSGASDDETDPAGVSEEDKFNEVDQYEGTNPNTLDDLTGSLTHVASDGTNLVIRVNIDQALTEGNCQLSLTSGDNLYSANAFIFSTGSIYSSCEGFDVPLSELAASNVWAIKINLTSGDKTGVITGEARL